MHKWHTEMTLCIAVCMQPCLQAPRSFQRTREKIRAPGNEASMYVWWWWWCVCICVCIGMCVCIVRRFTHVLCWCQCRRKNFPIVWEVAEALKLFDVKVVSFTSDGGKPNRRFYRLYQEKPKKGVLPYKTTNPYRADTQLYFFCDAPHLLKTTTNSFSNSFAHSQSRYMMVKSNYSTCNFI